MSEQDPKILRRIADSLDLQVLSFEIRALDRFNLAPVEYWPQQTRSRVRRSGSLGLLLLEHLLGHPIKCFSLIDKPSRVKSILVPYKSPDIARLSNSDLTSILFLLLLLLGLAQLLGSLSVKLRQPKVVGEILANVVIGPALVGRLPFALGLTEAVKHQAAILNFAYWLGLLLLIFLSGAESRQLLTVGVAVTSVPVVSKLFADLKILHTRFARLCAKQVCATSPCFRFPQPSSGCRTSWLLPKPRC